MKISQSGNERFYRDRMKLEVAAENAHKRLFRKHKTAFNQFIDLISEREEAYVRENYPDLAKSADLVYASAKKLDEVRSDDQARLDALRESLVAEMKEMAAVGAEGADPIVKLRADFRMLSTFRVKFLDGVDVDFWLFNALSSVGYNARNWLSGPVIKAWCQVQNIDADSLVAALNIVSPLWEKRIRPPRDSVAAILSRLDDYPFDIDHLLLNVRHWREANHEVVEGMVIARGETPALPVI